MPVLKIKTKPYSDDYALENVVHYVLRPGCSCGGYAVDPNYAVEQMLMVKDIWGKNQGRRVRHFILSFARDERIRVEAAMWLGFQICQYYSRFQTVYALHDDSSNLHLHFVSNTVSYADGKMYSAKYDDWYKLCGFISGLLPEHWHVTLDFE